MASLKDIWERGTEDIDRKWNETYGSINKYTDISGGEWIELTTGGWSDNEDIVKHLGETMFWFYFWQESKRGGHYKFAINGGELRNENSKKGS